MKIVHIEDFFHPEAGYQINILPKYMVKCGHEVTIITSEMEKIPELLTSFFGRENIQEKDKIYSDAYGVKIIRIPLRAYVSGRAVFTKKLFETIRVENPDVVYVHGNDTLTGMRYLIKAKSLGYPFVMDSHMLEMASVNKFNKIYRRIYRFIFTPQIVKQEIPVIRTQDDCYVEKCLGIPLQMAPWISVGTDTLLFYPNKTQRKQFREENNIPQDAFVIIYAGKLDESKGGKLLADAMKKKFVTEKTVVCIIVGKTNGEYGKQIEETFVNSENTVLRYPTQTYGNLSKFYQAADLAVFPRQCSLSFYDVQACGLPVVFEDNNINQSRAEYNNATVFEVGSVEKFREAILKYINMSKNDYDEMSRNAVELVKSTYDYSQIVNQYMEVIDKKVKNKSKRI